MHSGHSRTVRMSERPSASAHCAVQSLQHHIDLSREEGESGNFKVVSLHEALKAEESRAGACGDDRG
jgi:hypothetical protein